MMPATSFMKSSVRGWSASGWLLLGLAASFGAATPAAVSRLQAAEPSAAALSETEADEDFARQGEYVGQVTVDNNSVAVGAQIIARGNGKFRAVGYIGGLPGEGWNFTPKREADGQLEGEVVKFGGDEITAEILNGKLTVKNSAGTVLGEMNRVIRKSPTMGQKPPAGATVLFDGSSADEFQNGQLSPEGWLMQGVTSHKTFQDHQLHLEFLLPYMPTAADQGRANSGCYLQGRYEVQILDSFGLAGRNNECGGIYSIRDPDMNLCFPPLSWQTYDIDFKAAKYNEQGEKMADAKITVRHNGVLIHKNVALPKATTAAPVAEGADPGPLYLQDHGNPVRFRNIWVVAK